MGDKQTPENQVHLSESDVKALHGLRNAISPAKLGRAFYLAVSMASIENRSNTSINYKIPYTSTPPSTLFEWVRKIEDSRIKIDKLKALIDNVKKEAKDTDLEPLKLRLQRWLDTLNTNKKQFEDVFHSWYMNIIFEAFVEIRDEMKNESTENKIKIANDVLIDFSYG